MLRLKFERQQHRISQHAVALAARVHQPEISAIERGRRIPTREELERLAAVFRIPPDELLKDVVVLGPQR